MRTTTFSEWLAVNETEENACKWFHYTDNDMHIAFMNETIEKIFKEELKWHKSKIQCIYLYGSRCYGIDREDSDYDFTVVAKASVENVEYVFDNFNIHVQTADYFQKRLDWNDPKVIECLLWSQQNSIVENLNFEIKIVPSKYRHAVSQISSNSWVKAGKKIEQGDIFIGQKSLYHSLRIPMYAIQVMKHGDIIDWKCANKYWEDIIQNDNWESLAKKYKPIRNKIMTEFRELCPK